MEIRILQPSDDRSLFQCGDDALNRFFRTYAGQNQFRHHLGVTYVAVERGQVVGYATVAPAQIEIDELPVTAQRKLPRYPLPVLRLARLAVDRSAQSTRQRAAPCRVPPRRDDVQSVRLRRRRRRCQATGSTVLHALRVRPVRRHRRRLGVTAAADSDVPRHPLDQSGERGPR